MDRQAIYLTPPSFSSLMRRECDDEAENGIRHKLGETSAFHHLPLTAFGLADTGSTPKAALISEPEQQLRNSFPT
jgi:hypothetical protein